MTDTTGASVLGASYKPFGEVYAVTGSAANDNRFPGQWFQLESGLNYNWHRHYDPSLGRYTQADPLGLVDGPSRYAYALNAPSVYTDPRGLEVQICSRPVNIEAFPDWFSRYISPYHNWVKTDSKEAGMRGRCPVPGQGCADVPYTNVEVGDHTGESLSSNASCMKMNNVDEECVNNELEIGKPLGTWNPFNQCQSFAWSVVTKCRTGPQLQ